MQFSTKTTAPEKTRTGCAILPVLGGKPTASGKAIDAASGSARGAGFGAACGATCGAAFGAAFGPAVGYGPIISAPGLA
jgi:hypothetical protein